MNKLHHGFYAFMARVIKPYFYLTGYRWKKYTPKSDHYLVLTNHNTNWDFFMFGLMLQRHMYFVASEHIYRHGLTSWIIKTLGGPIPRRKGAAADDTIQMIKDTLNRGENVCMMAEGNRSFSGETGFISPKTAELVKECGAGLICLTVHGGYLVNPRWSRKTRRGPTWGRIAGEYTTEQLAEMSTDEIYEILKKDLYVDAYEDQKSKMAKYRCARPAEHLECALFWCPECQSMTSMSSRKDRFRCTNCGHEVLYDDYGYFRSVSGNTDKLYPTVKDWFEAQLNFLREKLPQMNGEIFSDEGMKISHVVPGVGTELIATGKLHLYKDRLEFTGTDETVTIPLDSIEKSSLSLTDVLLLTAGGIYYEIRPAEGSCCALKYLIASRLLVGKPYY